jgi:hypoxanthine phosphoribosyltransferase
MKQILEGRPGSLRLAVLFDKPDARKVNLKAEYTGFSSASNNMVGFGLSGRAGLHRNLSYVGLSRPERRHASTAGRRRTGRGKVKGRKG